MFGNNLRKDELKHAEIEMEGNNLLDRLKDKMVEIPDIEDVLEKIASIQLNKAKNVRIEITTKDFIRSENVTYEKILKVD